MKPLGVLAMVVVALVLTLSLGGASAATAPKVNYYTLGFDGARGYALGAYREGGYYNFNYTGNPGPVLKALDNESFSITLYANDQYSHAFFIDLNNDTMAGQNDPIQPDFYYAGHPGQLAFSLGAGSYVYRDWTNTSWYGTIVVEQHYEPWFKWDPFFIFGLMMAFAIIGWVGYVVFQSLKIARNRRRIRSTNPGILKWVKVVMDPESPTRPTQQYVDNVRVEKRKRRKAQVAEMKQSRDPPKPPSDGGNGGLNLG